MNPSRRLLLCLFVIAAAPAAPACGQAPRFALTPLLFEPDTKYLYSNAGINTAGRIVEVVSGVPFERFVEERLLRPLGMVDTTFWPDEDRLKRLAKSYRPKSDATAPSLEETPIRTLRYPLSNRAARHPMPAGGYFSTAAGTSTS